MYCWSPSSTVHQAAFISPTPSNRPFQYDILMSQRGQSCYFQNQPMFPSRLPRGHTATMEYSPCAKAPLNLGLGTIASPSRLDESLVYQDPSPEVLNALPVYFRVKPTLRTPSGKRCRKSRTVFTEMQLKVLEKTFCEQRYLDTTSRAKLAQSLALNETQIKTWFQNRRMKHKKESKTGNENEGGSQASCAEKEK